MNHDTPGAFVPTDEQLSAWLDGELPAALDAQIEAWLLAHPHEAARVQGWRADRDALRAHFEPVVREPVPGALQAQVLLGPVPAQAAWPRWKLAAGAATLLLAGGVVGAWVHSQWQPAATALARGSAAPWVERAAMAHAVYSPEVRHPVEVSVREGDATAQKAQEEHLTRWLTRRLDIPVKLFDLRDQGFELVGGRLLPDGGQPGAQLMYQDATGVRVTVYLRRPDHDAPASFQFRQEGHLGMFYWVEGTAGYALVGALPRERLLAMAQNIYNQCPSRSGTAAAAPKAASR